MARSVASRLLTCFALAAVVATTSASFAAKAFAQAPAPAAEPPRAAPGEVVTEIDPIDIPPEHDPLAHAWDRPGDRGGFYLRLSTTLGVHNTALGPAPWESDDGRHAHGFGTNFGLDIGGFVTPWLALHLDSSVGMLWDGNVHYETSLNSRADESARIGAYGFAPGATFFVPHGFLFKTAFGVGFATVKQPGPDITTNPGFYMDLMAGKELYADEHFSLAIQFQVLYMLLGYDSKGEAAAYGTSDLDARVRQYMFGFSFGFDSM